MKLEIHDSDKNYVCQIIKLPAKKVVPSLDNLVSVTHQGNDVLVRKTADEAVLYLFFPAECKIDPEYLALNNEFREPTSNANQAEKGFFESNCRVKAIRFKGVTSTGYLAPVTTLYSWVDGYNDLKEGDEFNRINGKDLCTKYTVRTKKEGANLGKSAKVLDGIVDSKLAPEHPSTEHLYKNIHKLNAEDTIAVTIKLHGTSARYFNTVTLRKLSWIEKILKKIGIKVQTEEYSEVVGSRKVIKSVGFEAVNNKNHFFESGDIWSKVGEQFVKGKLNKGEALYGEIIGKTYTGEAIQGGYSYGFDVPALFVYRISNINPQGIEIDLPYLQTKVRAAQLGLQMCPEVFYGKLEDFLEAKVTDDRDLMPMLENKMNSILEKPALFDQSVVEEGFVIRKDNYGKPTLLKLKSKKFLLHESGMLDKEVISIEDEA